MSGSLLRRPAAGEAMVIALGLTADRARSSLRFSLGHSNTVEQVDQLVGALEASVAHLRRISVHA